ncbi:MAG TPA: 4Fe-4S binding protein [Candidatus Hydrogenedentes bacterium]|nr:4Fe-4S binding protein [Candidatus Hydrogenedentota bacterium]
MGHKVNPEREYRLLQQRLDNMVTGAPDSPALMQILRLLYTPEDAGFARRIPATPTPLETLARRLEMPVDELDGRISEMAARGLLLDFYYRDRRFVMLPPVVVGFFEFVFMRAREDLPMAEIARLFDQYMRDDGKFARAVFGGETQLGRTLVHEEALPDGDHTEVLDWERATHLIGNAAALGVSLCACRHKREHLGEACNKPMEVCLTLDGAAESMVRHGIARGISNAEGLRIVEECKAAGLAQTGDNVQRNVTFICNCCGCCCGMMQAMKTFNLRNAIVTSNWVMEVDAEKCSGCGRCAQACPAEAIHLEEIQTNGKKRKRAVCEADLCLGCGVCYHVCKTGGIQLKARPQRVLTPENTFDRVVRMAIERGKLAPLIFSDPDRLSHRALGRMLGILENSPPWKAAMAVKPLRSAFLNRMVRLARP